MMIQSFIFCFVFPFFGWNEKGSFAKTGSGPNGRKQTLTKTECGVSFRFVSFRLVWFGLVWFRLCSLCTHQGSDAALIDIEILSSDSGAPVVEMHGYAAEVMRVVRFIPSLVSLVAVSSHACLAAASSPRASHRVRIA
jgi:hypothetical protein